MSAIGEFELIRRISKRVKPGPSVVKGIGDDCAVLKYTKGKYLLFTTDMIIEDIHFKRAPALSKLGIAGSRKGGASPEQIGHKALAVNISDIAACGGTPKWAVVSVGLPAQIGYGYTRAIFSGIETLARRFNIDIVGGDTNLSDKLMVSVALMGEVKKKELTLRSGAKDKDIIVLTGPIEEEPDHLNFIPQLKEARYLVKNLKVNSMIDISDGFLSDLNHILSSSRKGAVVYECMIPRPSEAPVNKLLNTGEQFHLIFTIPPSELKKLPRGTYAVGTIQEKTKGIVYVTMRGKKTRIPLKGYEHFR
ncbi:MAG: thiamine-monophosphate kinase [Candidatus Omnitrophica bacterium]|nr:thiamine-monophosphate kinase [Candidatus Omnitrophota bacterium]